MNNPWKWMILTLKINPLRFLKQGQKMSFSKPVLIFRHIACEGPGYLGQVLRQKGIPYRLICVDEGEEIVTPKSCNPEMRWTNIWLFSRIRGYPESNLEMVSDR